MSDKKDKARITITVDKDVLAALTDLAEGQRDSLSGMANRIMAMGLGLIPRLKDQQ